MQFNSYDFILFFLPILIVGYFVINRFNFLVGKYFVILMSCFFYAYSNVKMTIVLVISIFVNYSISRIMHKVKKQRNLILFCCITINVLLLVYFKYFNFLIANINQYLKTNIGIKELILPLGISFFTFQQVAYAIKIYKGEIVDLKIIDYLLYILFFPKLIMGPIVEPDTIIKQFNDENRKKVDFDNLSCGIRLFSYGLFKKMILADTFALAVNWGFNNIETATSMDLIIVMLAYTFEIYFDFSGYSDMAVGIANMINIELPINFNSPYKATSVRDFWKRWHISLTGFLTKYLYFPLGGSKKGLFRTYLNTLIVFLVSGIWHGANWTFILWGGLHGILCVSERIFEKFESKLIEAVRWFTTFALINGLWLLFRSNSISQWLLILKKIFCFQSMYISDGIIKMFKIPESDFIINTLNLSVLNGNIRGFCLLVFFFFAFVVCLVPENNYITKGKLTLVNALASAGAFIWSFICLSSESIFVYFNF